MKTTVLATLFVWVGSHLAIANVIFGVNINTIPLQGQQGYFAFDFIGGTPIENNTVTISNFASDAVLGALTPTGGASGTISPGPGTLNDSQFFNELLQAATFGTAASFDLDLTTNATSVSIPDTFALYLLDSMQNPFTTSDSTGADSLFAININGPSLTPDVYISSSATATLTSTPEPGTFGLLAIAGIGLGVVCRSYRRSKRS